MSETFDYASLASTASELISGAGRTVRILVQSSQAEDPQKPWNGNDQATLDFPGVPAVVFPTAYFQSIPPMAIDRDAEAIAFVASFGLSSEVQNATYLEESDRKTRWRVVGVEPIKPGETSLMFTFYLAR